MRIIIVLLLVALSFVGYHYLDNAEVDPDDVFVGDDDDDDAPRVRFVDGEQRLRLTDEEIDSIGLVAEPVAVISVRPTLGAMAIVLDVTPIIEAQSRIESFGQQQRLMANAEQDYRSRLASLSNGVASSRETNQLRVALRDAEQKVIQAAASIDAEKYAIQKVFGAEIVDHLESNSSDFDRLVSRQVSLLKIILPMGVSLPNSASVIHVGASRSQQTRAASYVGALPGANIATYNVDYLYWAETNEWPSGTRLFAEIPTDHKPDQRIDVPDSAVIWHHGRAWAYIARGGNEYARVPVRGDESTSDNALVLQPGDHIVTVGAQMLLSEEFKSSIPEEDDD